MNAILKACLLASFLLSCDFACAVQPASQKSWVKGKDREECRFGVGFKITQEEAVRLALSHFTPICAAKDTDVKKYSIKVSREKCEFRVVIGEPENCIHGGGLYTIDGRTGAITDFFAR
jgi:hypothetical protein